MSVKQTRRWKFVKLANLNTSQRFSGPMAYRIFQLSNNRGCITAKPNCRSAITDSEEEDSAESSTDEEGDEMSGVGNEEGATSGSSGGSASRKILKYIDKITQSKYFKHAAEIKYIKKAMEEVSNTPLILTVEIRNLSGTLALNIPPPPSDRLWYGFRGNPRLWLSAKPKVGEREVTVTHITDWIEKKLALEFQRVLVMPNMDDLLIPILCPTSIACDPEHSATYPDLDTVV